MPNDHGRLGLAIRKAYSLAQDAFVDYDMYLHTSQHHAIALQEERLEGVVRELALKLLAAFEHLRMPETAQRLMREVEKVSASAVTYDDDMGGLYSIALELIRPYVEVVEAVAGRSVGEGEADSSSLALLEALLRRTARYLYLLAKVPENEAMLQRGVSTAESSISEYDR